MAPERSGIGWPTRAAAIGLVAAAFWLCNTFRGPGDAAAARPAVFALIVALSGGFILMVRGIGAGRAAAAGFAVGLGSALLLGLRSGAPREYLLVFVMLDALITAVLGYLVGGSAPSRPAGTAAMQNKGIGPVLRRALPAERGGLGAWLAEFSAWLDSGSEAEDIDWPAFDQFVRQLLREQVGASGVRLFHVNLDGRLEPLARGGQPPAEATGAAAAILRQTMTTGELFVAAAAGNSDHATEPTANRAAGARASQLPWSWLLPLSIDGRTRALLTIGDVRRDGLAPEDELRLAGELRDLLRLFWLVVDNRRMRDHSGLLGRGELLAEMAHAAEDSAQAGEPLAVLILTLEGVRSLDDHGRWNERDELVRRLGQALRERVRSDDLIGRFSDDRFVVVLRRVDAALGERIARKIIQNVRERVLPHLLAVRASQSVEAAAPRAGGAGIRVRAGLAISPTQPTARIDGGELLELAFELVDQARAQREELSIGREGRPQDRAVGAALHDATPIGAPTSGRPSAELHASALRPVGGTT